MVWRTCYSLGLRALLTTSLACLAVEAGRADVTNHAFFLEVSAGTSSGAFIVPCAECYWDSGTSSFYWGIHDVNVPILDDITGEPLAYIEDVSAHAALGTTWYTKVDVSLRMGPGMAAVTIRGPLLQFPTIPDEHSQGRATMTLSVTDVDQPCNNAWAAGVGTPGTGIFHAYYNGVEFTNLLAQVFAGACSTATGGQNDPPTGYRNIPADVSNIETEFTFIATPNDRVQFSGAFRLLPPPMPCVGDLDGDRDVDVEDMALMMNQFGLCQGQPGFNGASDYDQDGCTDIGDVAVLLSNYGAICD